MSTLLRRGQCVVVVGSGYAERAAIVWGSGATMR